MWCRVGHVTPRNPTPAKSLYYTEWYVRTSVRMSVPKSRWNYGLTTAGFCTTGYEPVPCCFVSHLAGRVHDRIWVAGERERERERESARKRVEDRPPAPRIRVPAMIFPKPSPRCPHPLSAGLMRTCMQWFRGGIVFETHRLLYHSAQGSRTPVRCVPSHTVDRLRSNEGRTPVP